MNVWVIKRKGKRYNSKNFDSYEEARQYVRKKIRTWKGDMREKNRTESADWLACEIFWSNASIGDYGFTVEKRGN